MSRRYRELKVLNQYEDETPREKKRLETAFFPEIVETNSDILVVSQAGDRFDKLAHQFYGEPELWWFIAKANNMKFNNIPAGTKLRIPATPNGAYALSWRK